MYGKYTGMLQNRIAEFQPIIFSCQASEPTIEPSEAVPAA
jgi:hypothetical protein